MSKSLLNWTTNRNNVRTTLEHGDKLEFWIVDHDIPLRFPGATEIAWLGSKADEFHEGKNRIDAAFTWMNKRGAVAAKNYGQGLGEGDVSKYIKQAADRGYDFLVVYATAGLTKDARRQALRDNVIWIDKRQMKRFDFHVRNYPKSMSEFRHMLDNENELTSPPSYLGFSLRDDVVTARRCVLETLKNHDRCQLIAPPGFGKTVAQANIIHESGAQITLTFVPNSALVVQLISDYIEWIPSTRQYVAVFSENLEEAMLAYTGGVQSTTKATELAKVIENTLLTGNDLSIVSTYHSVDTITEASTLVGDEFEFALLIDDEAHRTVAAGGTDKFANEDEVRKFGRSLSDEYVPATKRVFCTATPRVYSAEIKAKAAQDDEVTWTPVDMSDEAVYGPVAFKMTMMEAMAKGYITYFDMHVPVVSEKDVREILYPEGGKNWVDLEDGKMTDFEDAAKALWVLTKIKPRSCSLGFMNKIVSITGPGKKSGQRDDLSGMKRICERIAESLGLNLKVEVVTGNTEPEERNRILDMMRDSDRTYTLLVLSVRVFNEGVSVPALDNVIFFDARSSTVDITQCIGRALRTAEGKVRAGVFVPVFVPDTNEAAAKAYLMKTKFGALTEVALAIRDDDELATDIITEYSDGGETESKDTGNGEKELTPPPNRNGLFVTTPADWSTDLVSIIKDIALGRKLVLVRSKGLDEAEKLRLAIAKARELGLWVAT